MGEHSISTTKSVILLKELSDCNMSILNASKTMQSFIYSLYDPEIAYKRIYPLENTQCLFAT